VIFVTVGNARQSFRRLLEAVDSLAGEGVWGDEPVFLQTGNDEAFRPRHSEYKSFLHADEFQHLMGEADVIVTHGGCGTILNAFQLGKIPVVMPRRRKYGEHINDHQMQLVAALVEAGRIIPAYEPAELVKSVDEARRYGVSSASVRPSQMINLVAQAIDQLRAR
jgi:UDP-N-acetylglucosamine transferase subunit ALG13